jgi:thiamine transporter
MRNATRVLVESALAAALTVALSYLRLWTMPQGGSITLENVPIIVLALLRGPRAGLGAGAIAGLIQLLLGGYVVHPAQAVLDYPLAFGALGLAGFLRRPAWGGVLLGSASRFLCHVLSGVVFFASYAPEGTNVWAYSAIYNGSFMAPNALLTVLVVYLLLPRLKKIV